MRWGFLLLAVASSGCATSWTIGTLAGVHWSNNDWEHDQPIGPLERHLRVAAKYEPPPPAPPLSPAEVVAVPAPPPPPPPPGVYLVVPAAPPPPPEPSGALRFECVSEERYPVVHEVHDFERYNLKFKLVAGLLVLGEGMMGAAAIAGSTPQNDPKATAFERAAMAVIGALFAGDALGTVALLFHPVERGRWEEDRPGGWTVIGRQCPAGLALQTPRGPAPVAPDGSVGDAGPGILRQALATPEPRFTLLIDGAAIGLAPSEREKCDWANASGAVARAAGCDWREGPRQTVAQVPLPADAPIATH